MNERSFSGTTKLRPNETLDIDEAAALLKIHPVTLSEKASRGEIPGARIGKRWVFIAVDLITHIRSQYIQQAVQGDLMKVKICHSTKEKTHHFGGSKSRPPTEHAYNKALGLPIN
jgi:excisionase family DNA binding protein